MLDTDIGNYNLQDILKLFKLPIDFGEADLKRAKRTTMKTHPDVSRLPADYFRFFCAAYRMLEQIYECRHSRRLREAELETRDAAMYMNTKYEVETDGEKALLLKDITKRDDFGGWFNNMFEKLDVHDGENDRGYEEWLRSSDSDAESAAAAARGMKASEMDAYFEARKASAAREASKRQLVRHNGGIAEFNQAATSRGGGYELDRSGQMTEQYSYASGVFDKLQYEDLKKAHTETVIPVSIEEELRKRPQFNSVEDYTSFRERQNVLAPTEEESRGELMRSAKRDSEFETQRAFNLIRQDEEGRRNQEKWWGTLRSIRG